MRDWRCLHSGSSAMRLIAFCVFLVCAGANHATGQSAPSALATGPVALPSQRPAWALQRNDQGVLAGDVSLRQLSVVLKRSAQRQAAFERFLRDLQDPRSADYHHWLSPLQVGERFGVAQADLEAVSGWLRGQGLHVDSLANSRTRLTFSGTAAAIGAAFATEIHRYGVNGKSLLAPADAPRIPASLHEIIKSISGLYTIGEHPGYGAGAAMLSAPAAAQAAPGGSFCDGSGCRHYLFPADFATIYGIAPVYQRRIDGSGQTIAIIGRARASFADIENFQLRSGLAVRDPLVIVPPDGVDPGPPLTSCGGAGCTVPEDQFEATIDVTRATSVAPGAAIDLVVSADTASRSGLRIAAEHVVDTNPPPAQILSLSFGACEADGGQAGVDFYDSLFSQAAAEGISVFVISGDSGVAGCNTYNSAPTAGLVASPNFICVSSYATCVGGTQFADSVTPGVWWNSANGAGNGSALGYIPEGAWNEPLLNGTPQTSASGGGVSAYIPTPSWQTGIGIPGTAGRYTPDVSFSASAHDGYFMCLAAAGNSCVVENGQFRFEYIFGTSASTPDMAGVAALLNQQMGEAQGNLNPRLYALAAHPDNGVFHDVTVASSGVADCASAIPSPCNNSTPGLNGLAGGVPGYLVGVGYDEVTGLGSIDVDHLLAQWRSGAALVNLDQHGLSGAWYNPATSGQGIVMEVDPDLYGPGLGLLFGGWFTFDSLGGPRWYTIQGQVGNTSAAATMPIYASTGGSFNAAPATTTSKLGMATLQFSDCTHGSLDYTFSDGSDRRGHVPLTRLSTNVTCTAQGDNGAPPSDYLLSGAWYNPPTSGQGFVFDINPSQNILFAAWYTFAHDATPNADASAQRWYTIQASFVPGISSLDGIGIFETSGGVFNTPSIVTTALVGRASVAFHGCATATLGYAFSAGTNSGQTGTVELSRIAPVPAACGL